MQLIAVALGAEPQSLEGLKADVSRKPELHGVSIGRGGLPAGERRLARDKRAGSARVVVDHPGTNIVLFLGAGKRTVWHLTVREETVLERIIVGGYYHQEVMGDIEAVPIEHLSYKDAMDSTMIGTRGKMPSRDVLEGKRLVSERPQLRANTDRKAFLQEETDYKFTQLARRMREHTGLSFSSYTAQYAALADVPIVLMEDWIPKGDPAAELHFVSFHIARQLGGKQVPRGETEADVKIKVSRPGKRVVLFLSAYDPLSWDLEVAPGTTLAGVILGGYERQDLIEAVRSTRTLRRYGESHGAASLPGCHGDMPSADVFRGERRVTEVPYGRDQPNLNPNEKARWYSQAMTDYAFSKTLSGLRELTGLKPTSYHIIHTIAPGSTLIVD